MELLSVLGDLFKQGIEHIKENYPVIIFCILEIIFVILLGWIVKKIVYRIIERIIRRKQKHNVTDKDFRKTETVLTLMKSITKYLLIFFVTVAILSIIGLKDTVASVIATAGIGGIAIGIGANALIKDTIAGFFILLDDEFAVGDTVKIGDIEGVVESIAIRTTRVKLADNSLASIPNGEITTVYNYSRDNYQITMSLELELEADSDLIGRIIEKEANAYIEENGIVPGNVNYLGVNNYTPVAQVHMLLVTVEPSKRYRVAREMRQRIVTELRNNGIVFPKSEQVVVK